MKRNISKILIPTDFSEPSERALKVGTAIAKRQKADITLLYVLDRYSHLQPSEVFLPGVKIGPDIKSSLEEKLNVLSKKIHERTKINTTFKVVAGNPSGCICEFAFQEDFSLIVMGSHGISGIREFFMGSEAFRVVKNATCPVLTVPGDWQKTEFGKILFPIRLIPGALDKYSFARPIIEKNKSELILLGLADKKKPDEVYQIAGLMDKFKYQLHNDNVVFQPLLCPCENFPEKVINSANENHVDLIVLTANLDYDLKAYFIGAFSQQIVNHSKRPVLCIKPSMVVADKTDYSLLADKWGGEIDFSDVVIQTG